VVIFTAIAILGHLDVPSVGGNGTMTPGLPGLTEFMVPLTLETLSIVWPTALSVAFVGLLESLLTAKLVDDITDTRSHKNRESWALGVANIAAGFYGGIAGCAMIAQTVVNVKMGHGRTRVSTAVAALVLLVLVTAMSGLMAKIPMVAFAGVMMVAALTTVNWRSLSPQMLTRMPKSETTVMIVTVVLTVATGNLAIGVAGGVLLAMMLFARVSRTSTAWSARSAKTGARFVTACMGRSSSAAATTCSSGSPTPTTRRRCRSISPRPRSGMPRASRRSTPSRPSTASMARRSPSPVSTGAAPRSTRG
jgi:MFS superfamily sulfate permease-like transporter